MPITTAPSVYVEEIPSGFQAIDNVPVSTAGMAGLTHYGPTSPQLITSFHEFERIYGGLELLEIGNNFSSVSKRIPYLAHAVKAFFTNGGKRMYVCRTFIPRSNDQGVAAKAISDNDIQATWQAYWPGRYGNANIETFITHSDVQCYEHSKEKGYRDHWGTQIKNIQAGSVIEILEDGNTPLQPNTTSNFINSLRVVDIDTNGRQLFINARGEKSSISLQAKVRLLQAQVHILINHNLRFEFFNLSTSPRHERYIAKVLSSETPEKKDCPIWFNLHSDASLSSNAFWPALLMASLQKHSSIQLEGGHDGDMPTPEDFIGSAIPNGDINSIGTGLTSLAGFDDISIVALPDSADMHDRQASLKAAELLLSYVKKYRHRFAIIDSPKGSSIEEIREFRRHINSNSAAIYYPWVNVFDPNDHSGRGIESNQIALPPSGFIAGIYARVDAERGIHKAPASEKIHGIARLEHDVNTQHGDALNLEAINVLRFFQKRGHLVWGARTLSTDPEWKYINTRRFTSFIERSIEQGLQWAIFAPNNELLWLKARSSIDAFLYNLWRNGALEGIKTDEAYFVRCDTTTMTQNDIDDGRLICQIGFAPMKPAEFIILNISVPTAKQY